MYYATIKKQKLPKGVLAGELLYRFLTKEYIDFYTLLQSERTTFGEIDSENFNCQLFAMFAYLADCLSALSWIKLCIFQGRDKETVSDELKKEGLWQLAESIKDVKVSVGNPLLFVLALAEIINPFNIGCEPELANLFEMDFDAHKQNITVKIPLEISQEATLEYRLGLEKLNLLLENASISIRYTA